MASPWPTAPRTVFFDDVSTAPTRTKATKDGRIRRIATGVWTADLSSTPEQIVAENVYRIISRRIGPSVVVDRTAALSGRPDRGVIAVSTDGRRSDLVLPGVVVRVRPLVAHESDSPYLHDLRIASPARSIVDNLRGPSNADRYMTEAELQDAVAHIKVSYEPRRFERLQQDAHQVAQDFGLDIGDRIDSLFATINNLPGAKPPKGALAIAAHAGDQYDEKRLELFARLRGHLTQLQHTSPPPVLGEPHSDGELPFFEAYFSNYIEGTEFLVEEARRIVELNEMPADRPEDAHDILNTYHCVASRVGRAATGTTPAEIIGHLTTRHETFMKERSTLRPGEFKLKPNRVGMIEFVKPELVAGTLRRAFEPMADVPRGFFRGVYVMAVVAEVHPFVDGNGRAARLMMNAELSAAGLVRIVVPTVMRNEYMSSLRRFSTNADAEAMVRVLERCWRWTSRVPWDSRSATEGYLNASYAFMDSSEAAEKSLSLQIL